MIFYNNGATQQQSQQPTDASHRFTCFRQWCITVGGKKNTACQIQNTARKYRKLLGIRHMFIQTFFLRMTDTMTSQNTDLSSWDTCIGGPMFSFSLVICYLDRGFLWVSLVTPGKCWDRISKNLVMKLSPTYYPIHYFLIIISFDTLQSKQLKMSLNKQ
jgi:hypothetical protein